MSHIAWQEEALHVSQLLSAELFLALASYAANLATTLPGTSTQLFNFGSALIEVGPLSNISKPPGHNWALKNSSLIVTVLKLGLQIVG